ncbi:MAG TPA: hypothetical protein VG323_02960 [Thermoanaerobaculia bacterium]|nr:hypothetical protein [Thermoanaerobaculia bacterium]
MRSSVVALVLAFVAATLSAQVFSTQPTASLRKAVVPVVGSTPGANGAQFKTSLRIQALPGAHGRIVFHRLGTMGSDADPSLTWSFPDDAKSADFIQYDDVVAALGQSGLGSLDIIPDQNCCNIFPTVITRVFNDTANGTFGAEEELSYPVQYFAPSRGGAQAAQTFIPPMSTQFRRNVGFRTLSNVDIGAFIIRKDGTRFSGPLVHFPGEYMTMMSVEDFVKNYMHTTIAPDDALVVYSNAEGQAIFFYTYTDNGTNDPAIVVTPPVWEPILLKDIPN